jgi:succinate dehydrogenase / fumarate reductase flavoprotein subunit
MLHEALQDVMATHAGIARDGEGLDEGLQKVLALQERAKHIKVQGTRFFNPGWHMARDDVFMLTVAEAVMRAAAARTESRGAHWRLDYPDLSDKLGGVNFKVRKTDEGMELEPVPIPPIPEELRKLTEETK